MKSFAANRRALVVAKPISTATNPFSLSVVGLLLAAYAGSRDLREFSNWALIILFFIVILPLTYAYVRISTAGTGSRRILDPMAFFREHRRELWVISLVGGVPCILSLVFFKAPLLLVATLVALLGTSLAVTVVNRFFRASYHLSIVTTVAIIAVLIWGQAAFPALLVVPLAGWARYSLGQHSPTHLAAGSCLAVAVVAATFYSFGLLGM